MTCRSWFGDPVVSVTNAVALVRIVPVPMYRRRPAAGESNNCATASVVVPASTK
jgi:hypothetical protein